MPPNIEIRHFLPDDWPATWRVIQPVFVAGETFPCSPQITELEAQHYWIETASSTYVAVNGWGEITASYYIRPNQPPLGAHVCNCGYIVGLPYRGQGIASALCEHSQSEARAQGFRAMQYNLVVSTNRVGIHLWKNQGFRVVGTLPGAFRHIRLGFVDALVMYKELK